MWQSMGEHVELVGFALLVMIGVVWKQLNSRVEKVEQRVTSIEKNYISRFEDLTDEVRDVKETVLERIGELHIELVEKYQKKERE